MLLISFVSVLPASCNSNVEVKKKRKIHKKHDRKAERIYFFCCHGDRKGTFISPPLHSRQLTMRLVSVGYEISYSALPTRIHSCVSRWKARKNLNGFSLCSVRCCWICCLVSCAAECGMCASSSLTKNRFACSTTGKVYENGTRAISH